jgi:hypothetical protein
MYAALAALVGQIALFKAGMSGARLKNLAAAFELCTILDVITLQHINPGASATEK